MSESNYGQLKSHLEVGRNPVDYDIFADLTEAEVDQLENINSTVISTANWGHLASTNQDLGTTDDVTFDEVTVNELTTSAQVVENPTGNVAMLGISTDSQIYMNQKNNNTRIPRFIQSYQGQKHITEFSFERPTRAAAIYTGTSDNNGGVLGEDAFKIFTRRRYTYTGQNNIPTLTTEGTERFVIDGDGVVSITNELNVDTINEYTSAAGVTVDGVLIKDGLVDGIDIATTLSGFDSSFFNKTNWTPSLSNLSYIANTSGNLGDSWYQRIGNVVYFHTVIIFDAQDDGGGLPHDASCDIAVPVATNFASTFDLVADVAHRPGSTTATPTIFAKLVADSTNDNMELYIDSLPTGSTTFNFFGHYVVK